MVFRLFPFLLLPGVAWEFAPWLEAFESGTVFRSFPFLLLPGVFAAPEEEDDEDMLPEDELIGGVCASNTDAIAMLATELAIPI